MLPAVNCGGNPSKFNKLVTNCPVHHRHDCIRFALSDQNSLSYEQHRVRILRFHLQIGEIKLNSYNSISSLDSNRLQQFHGEKKATTKTTTAVKKKATAKKKAAAAKTTKKPATKKKVAKKKPTAVKKKTTAKKKATAKTTKKPATKKKVAKTTLTKKQAVAKKTPGKKDTVAKAAPKKRRPRKKKTYIRKKAIWSIYSPTMKIVAQFAFHEEKEAKEKLAKLNKKGKANHCMIRSKIEEEIPIEEMPVK
jgi:hypothetical protein